MENNNLLIIGAGQYGHVAKEIAESMGTFEKIDFLDDNSNDAVGKTDEFRCLNEKYRCAFVAIGNSQLRLKLIRELQAFGYEVVNLISPYAYISKSAVLDEGISVEPMAVINTEVRVECGCLISAGAVINHNSTIQKGCHIDCNATVPSGKTVPSATKVEYGKVFGNV